jgi:hypothetical protein
MGQRQSYDLSRLLRGWEYKEDKNVRRFRTATGREVLQVRLPLGIEQYELHGRPDGVKPEGSESWLDHYENLAQMFDREFVLDDVDCERLTHEGVLYYYRYLLFFQIQEFDLCIRDTSRNLRLLHFVQRHARESQQSDFLEQYRPYILRMHYMARALLEVKDRGDIRGALRLLRKGMRTIKGLPEMANNEVFDFERTRSIYSIQELASQLEAQIPLTPQEKLEKALGEAVRSEDYERAAELRDKLRDIEGNGRDKDGSRGNGQGRKRDRRERGLRDRQLGGERDGEKHP